MKRLAITLGALCASATFAGNAAAQPPRGAYTDDTVSLSYPMLEWIHRNLNKPGAVKRLRAAYPAADKLRGFLAAHMGTSMGNSIAVLAIGFATGRESAHYKMANDFGAAMPRVEGFTAEEIRSAAALCAASSLREVQWEADRKAVRSKSTSLETGWKLIKITSDDPLVPTEEAALLARDFLGGIRKDDPRLDKLSAATRNDILDYRNKFKSGLDNLLELRRRRFDRIYANPPD